MKKYKKTMHSPEFYKISKNKKYCLKITAMAIYLIVVIVIFVYFNTCNFTEISNKKTQSKQLFSIWSYIVKNNIIRNMEEK